MQLRAVPISEKDPYRELVDREWELVKMEDSFVIDEDGNMREPLTAHELLRHIRLAAKGEKIEL